MFGVRKRKVSLRRGDVSFSHTKHVWQENTDNNHFGGYIYLCLSPYNSNFQYFEIKSLGPRTSNLQDSTVYTICRIVTDILALDML